MNNAILREKKVSLKIALTLSASATCMCFYSDRLRYTS